ncbi:hypothetical protein Ddc_13292 [Ditylenchus destructor]|nr:hypothetical protein Ddc_13292 [Ditylenchus destructor]
MSKSSAVNFLSSPGVQRCRQRCAATRSASEEFCQITPRFQDGVAAGHPIIPPNNGKSDRKLGERPFEGRSGFGMRNGKVEERSPAGCYEISPFGALVPLHLNLKR